MSTTEKLVVENFLKDQSRINKNKTVKQVPQEVQNAVNDLEKSLTKDDPLLADNMYDRDLEKNLKNLRQDKIFKENVNLGNVEETDKKNVDETALTIENTEALKKQSRTKVRKPRPLPENNNPITDDNTQVEITSEKPQAKKRRRRKPRPNAESHDTVNAFNLSANTIKNSATINEHSAAIPETQEIPPPFVDDGNILGIEIHQSDHLRTDAIYLTHPVVSVGIVDVVTGNLLRKLDPSRRVTSYYESDNVSEILPLMTQPYDFKLNKSLLPRWNETLIFNEPFNRFTSVSAECKPIIFFVIKDFITMAKVNNKRSSVNEKGWYNIAWAFLKITDGFGNTNTKRKIRLQLFYPPKNKVFDNTKYPVYDWWINYPRQKYPATLYVTLKAIVPPSGDHPSLRSMQAIQPERGLHNIDDLQNYDIKDQAAAETNDQYLWSRFPGQNCKIPNVAQHRLWAGNGGAFRIAFSHRGTLLAVACKHDNSYPIVLYSIPGGNNEGILAGHQQLIYDFKWSKNDKFLLSASGDGTVQVWNISFKDKPVYTLPHPTYVYTAAFHPVAQETIATGGYDSILRVWGIKSQKIKLVQELEGHNALINSLVFEKLGSYMYSVDSTGLIICWQTPVALKVSRKESVAWSIHSKIMDPSMTGVFINSIILHPSNNKVLLQCRDSTIKMLDTRIHTLKSFSGVFSQRQLIRLSVTPCGNFVFSGSEDGKVYVWNAHTQDQVAVYTNLGFTATVHDVAYHPHDHMAAFCSFGDYLTVLLYTYDKDIASLEAGFKRHVALKSEKVEFDDRKVASTSYKFDKVLRTLEEVDESGHRSRTPGSLPPLQTAPLLSTWGSTFDSTMDTSVSKFASIKTSPYKKHNLSSEQKPNVSLTIDDMGNKSVSVDAKAVEYSRVLVLFDYEANRSDELNILRGDIIFVLFKDSDNWWYGKKATDGTQGYFPSSYVQEQEGKNEDVLFGSIPSAQEKKVHTLTMPDGRLQFYSQSESEGEGLSSTKNARQQRRENKLQAKTRSILKKPKIVIEKPSNEHVEETKTPETENPIIVVQKPSNESVISEPTVTPKEMKFEETTFNERVSSVSEETPIPQQPVAARREAKLIKEKPTKASKQKQKPRPLPPLSSTHANQSDEKFKFLKSVQSLLDKDLFDDTVIERHNDDGYVADISKNDDIMLEDLK